MARAREYRARRLLACVAAVCLAVLPAPARQAAPDRTTQDKLNRLGADLFSPTPHPAQAIPELKAILAASPDLAEAHLLLGIAYRAQASPELMSEAVAELRQAVSLKPSLLLARLTLARVYLDMARGSRAREELEAALAEAPGRPELLSLLGETERQLGNPRRSVELNQQVLQGDATFAQARYYLGLALLDLKRHTEAIRELQQVVDSGANPAETNFALGSAHLASGQVDRAIAALRESARVDPARPDTHIKLAAAYRSKGLLDEAARELKLATPGATVGLNALYRSIESDLYMEEGLLRLQQGRLEAAAESFRKVLAADANHEAAKLQLAAVRKRLQDRAKAKKSGAGS